MDGVRAVLLAGGEGRRMGPLGRGRLKPLVPFGGTSRLIDFSLANARRSGFREVLLLSQYEERRLMDDLQAVWNGSPGDFRVHFGPYDEAYRQARASVPGGGVPAALPDRTWPSERGTADALIKKAEHIFGDDTSEVLVLHADHVYRFDYGDMIRRHRADRAALTVSYQRIERRYVHLFGMVEFDTAGNLTGFVEKPAQPTSDLVFAAFCVFDARALRRHLERLDGTDWQHDISRDVIPAMLAAGERIRGYEVTGYWEDIGTVERYHRAHRGLLGGSPTLSLAELPLTVRPGVPRRYIEREGAVRSSIVPGDWVNAGRVAESVVYPGVTVGAGARVRDCVLLPGTVVPEGAELESAILLEDGTVQRCDPAPVLGGVAS
ncbi:MULTISPECIES: sugar phosphate nucleotidyltransferase [Streptomyces]|uniref:Glucose-1-phosphate adenylyltransferase n=1 Tax=Streptomyces chartreusis NRRL 3882 TaxID=1079985 RepID=A0A2N9B3E1_STRCX|nr:MULTISPECIES: sugar phosphate nucleotidyltransferase [Streptomyces]MYS89713.1 NTP transferase domain-containing protein [Streptomyces sp. SID5464]SOR77838.1 Glucose-1-phosphate adenylyltransferase [Streptomyces chartreusis NRRL 3882]